MAAILFSSSMILYCWERVILSTATPIRGMNFPSVAKCRPAAAPSMQIPANKAPNISRLGMPPRNRTTNISRLVNRVLEIPPFSIPAAVMMTGA